ncbi:MAG TPA: glutathione S-transferase family protein [Sphingomonadales bacterium]|nr:glutathione S-transferase family protein [Sphingomonadales bacterium]
MPELVFYHFPESGNSWKVLQLLHLLGLPHRRVDMAGLKGATRNEAFKKKNVDQRLPFVELPDGTGLAESNAILWHLARGSAYLPDDPLEQAQVLRWMFFEQNRIEVTIAVVRFQVQYVAREKRNREFEKALTLRGLDALGVMEEHLLGRDFFVGNRFTIADLALYAYTHCAGEGGFDLSRFPRILAWLKRVEALPGYIPFAA